MKPSLNTIVRTLNDTPSGVVTLGGTTFTLYPIVGRRRVAPPTPETPDRINHDHAQAMQLYGSELEAAAVIRRQLSTLGSDCDPVVRRRAETLAERMERGHKLRPVYESSYDWRTRKTTYTKPRKIVSYKVVGEWSKGILGKIELTEGGVNSLRKKGFNIILPTP